MNTLDEAHGRLTARLEDLEQDGARIPCRGPGSNIWISDKASDLAEAAAACQHCPAVRECRAYAVEHQESAGTWGGLAPKERPAARRSLLGAERSEAA